MIGSLSRGATASTYVGAMIHAFGLEPVFGDEDGDGVENNLKGSDFMRFGGCWATSIPRPATLLVPVSAEAHAAYPWVR